MKPIFGPGVVYDAPDWKFQNFRKYAVLVIVPWIGASD